MTVPRGIIWDGIRTEALNVISEDVATDLSRSLTFYDWREKGGYHVTGSTKKDFFVSCATREFAGMITREVSALLDQALEHRMLIADAFRQKKTPSRSWLLVTTYYWCVFLALAWLRLVGNVVTFLPNEEVERLRELGNKLDKAPTTGTYLVSVTDIDGARSNLLYRRLKSNNFHEGLWETFYRDIETRMEAAKNGRLDSEFQVFSAISYRNKFDKNGWLSKLRNAVNYRVGFAYGSVGGRSMPDMMETITLIKSANFPDLLKSFERSQAETRGRSVLERPEEYSRLMLLFGAVTTHMLEAYCKEIWGVRGIDPQWAARRNNYTRGFTETVGTLWPM